MLANLTQKRIMDGAVHEEGKILIGKVSRIVITTRQVVVVVEAV